MKARPTLPVAVDRAYELWLWLDQHVAQFSTHARHSLGQRLLDDSLALLDALVGAAYAPRASVARIEHIDRARHRVAMLNLLLRGARERRHLSVSQHEHAMKSTVALGKMIAGWIRFEREPAAP